MKYLVLCFLFLFLAKPVQALEIKLKLTVKSNKAAQKKKVLVASYKEVKQPVTLWDTFKERAAVIAKENDYPLSVLLGQAALESGRGTSHYAITRNNFFGINAAGSNPDLAYSFENIDKGIKEYIRLIKTQYPESYRFRDDPHKMIEIIKQSGYATDYNYVAKVTNLPEFKENL